MSLFKRVKGVQSGSSFIIWGRWLIEWCEQLPPRLIFRTIFWSSAKTSWIFIGPFYSWFLKRIIKIVVKYTKSCSPLQRVVMLLLSESHLWILRIRGLFPRLLSTLHQYFAESPWLLLVVVDMLFGCCRDFFVVVVLIPGDYACLGLAILSISSLHAHLLGRFLPALIALCCRSIYVASIVFPLIISIFIIRGGSAFTFSLYHGRFF